MDQLAVERLRTEAIDRRDCDRRNAHFSRKRKLHELYAVCRHIERSKPFPNAKVIDAWGQENAKLVLEDAERRFLEDNDIERGLFFNEATLPKYSHPLNHAPEPAAPAKPTPAPPTQAPPSPLPPPTFHHPGPHRTPSTPAEKLSPPPEARFQAPAKQDAAIASAQPPPGREETVPKPVPLLNGDVTSQDIEMPDLPVEKPEEQKPSLRERKPEVIIPSAPTPPQRPAPTPVPDKSAPIVDVGGIPVIQDMTTSIPTARERDAGVHPPPPPSPPPRPRLHVDAVVKDDEAVSSPSPAVPATATVPDSRPELDRSMEIPDSQPSPAKPSLEPSPPLRDSVEEARLPALATQLQQLPIHPPLLVFTGQGNQPQPVPPQELTEESRRPPEISSPTSSIEGGDNRSTPGAAVLSSATSPDPHHLVVVEDKAAVEGAVSVDASGTLQRRDILTQKRVDIQNEQDRVEEKPPSATIAEEVVEKESEVDLPLPTIPPTEVSGNKPLRADEEKKAQDLPTSDACEVQPEEPAVSAIEELPAKSPISPDPSAQLRLEDQLANGSSLPTLPQQPLAPLQKTNSPERACEQAKTLPPPRQTSPLQPPSSVPSKEDQADLDDEDEDEEDRVQLVGSNEPVTRNPSPTPTPTPTPAPTPIKAPSRPEPVLGKKEQEEPVANFEAQPIHASHPPPEPQKTVEPELTAPALEKVPEPEPKPKPELQRERGSELVLAPEQEQEALPQLQSEAEVELPPQLSLPEKAPAAAEAASVAEEEREAEREKELERPETTPIGISVPVDDSSVPPTSSPAEAATTPAPALVPKVVEEDEPKVAVSEDVEMGEADQFKDSITVGGQISRLEPDKNAQTEVVSTDNKNLEDELDLQQSETLVLDDRIHDIEKALDRAVPEIPSPPSPSPITPVGEPALTPAHADGRTRQIELEVNSLPEHEPTITAPTSTVVSTPQAPKESTEPPAQDAMQVDTEHAAAAGDAVKPSVPLPTPDTRPSSRPSKVHKRSRSQLSKVVISSAHHAAAIQEAEERRIREDQESQGMIVVARRRDQQAASAAARARSSTIFQPGSRMDQITRFSLADSPGREEKKQPDLFDALYTVQSYPTPIEDLLSKASKSVTTSNYDVQYFESQAVRVLTRIQQLQDEGLWSLTQIARVPEPRRKKVHWDYILDEMRWLREDFREERKWKIATAKKIAGWVMEWHTQPHRRAEITVNRRVSGVIPKPLREQRQLSTGGDIQMGEASQPTSQPTPELMEAGGTPEDEGSEDYFVKQEAADEVMGFTDDTDLFAHLNDPPPAGIFTLGPEETVYSIVRTKAADDMLEQLPLFAPPKPPMPDAFEEAQEEWLGPITPVTKYATGRLVLEGENEPPRKRMRYEYEVNSDLYADDSDEEGEVVNDGGLDAYGRPKSRDKTMKPIPLPPEQNEVALFRPEFKQTLQRVRSHTFKPPNEMPPLAFFEARAPSLWTPQEDDTLRLLAREYHHNWALISTFMRLDGIWQSGSERRSPWECFERWTNLEPIPQDFQKTPFYRMVQTRIDVAQRVGGPLMVGNVQGNQNSGSAPQQGVLPKRRGTVPIAVQKRRTTRTLSMVEGMRKLAKKRENAFSKQQQGSRAQAAQRKAQENSSANSSSSNSNQRTPRYFSEIKYEKEMKTAEQNALIKQLNPHAQRGSVPHQPGRLHPNAHLANGVPAQRSTSASALQSNGLVPGRPSPTHPLAPNGQQIPANAMRQPPRQYTQAEMAQMAQLQRLRHQHQLAQIQAQAQLHQNAQSTSASTSQPYSHHSQQQQYGHAANSSGTHMPGVLATAPHHATARKIPTQQEITAGFLKQFPNWSPEQIQLATQKHLQELHAQLTGNMAGRTPAMRVAHSASPGPGPGPTSNGGPPRSQAGTGVMMGANGPVGPGAQQAIAAAQAAAAAAAAGTTVGGIAGGNGGIGGTSMAGSRPATPAAASPRIPSQSPRIGVAGSPRVGVTGSPRIGVGQMGVSPRLPQGQSVQGRLPSQSQSPRVGHVPTVQSQQPPQ